MRDGKKPLQRDGEDRQTRVASHEVERQVRLAAGNEQANRSAIAADDYVGLTTALHLPGLFNVDRGYSYVIGISMPLTSVHGMLIQDSSHE